MSLGTMSVTTVKRASINNLWTLDLLCFDLVSGACAIAMGTANTWLPDGYSHIFRLYGFGPLGFWTMAPLRYAAKFDPFLSLDCAPTPSTLAQSQERKG